MRYSSQHAFLHKQKFAPDFLFEGEAVSFFYTYIRKNASTSFKKLFQALYPGACTGEVPSIRCMAQHAQVKDLTPEEIEHRFATRLFIYRDPIERVFSVYKNKVIQQDGAEDLLCRLEKVTGRDPSLLTFDEFVHDYVALLESERWEEVDSHLYPQVWHLLPITYTNVIRINELYAAMREIVPAELCDRVFKTPSNSSAEGSVPLVWADPDCPAVFFRRKYARGKALPSVMQLLKPATEARLRLIYSDDYRMIAEVEGLAAPDASTESSQSTNLNVGSTAVTDQPTPEHVSIPVFSSPEKWVGVGQSTVASDFASRFLDDNDVVSLHPDERIILEYGSTHGKKIAVATSDRFVMCVENDRKTARQLIEQQNSFKSPVLIFHTEIARNKSTTAEHKQASLHWRPHYLTEIWEQPFFRDPDLILISGHIKLGCFIDVLRCIRRPARLLFDGYTDQSDFHVIERLVKPARIIGSWAEFSLEPGILQALDTDFLSRSVKSRQYTRS